jgi:TfoX/Sxy family transcriptional regulator of competence genes
MPKKRSAPNDAAAATEIEPSFAPVVRAFAGDPRVTFGRMMAAPGLKVNGKIFAMLPRGSFVVKLPKARVDALIAAGRAERFDPGHGRPMKEWAVIHLGPEHWLPLAREAYDFVGAG